MNERLIEEADRLRREIDSGSRFVLFNEGYSDMPAESRALLGRQLILMQETLRTMDERIAFVRGQERLAGDRKEEADAENKTESGCAPDVFTQVRALLAAGAVHRSGMRIDQADLEKIRQHLSFEVVELNNLFQNKDAIDIGKVAEDACDILGVLVHMFVYLGMSEQDVANQCAEKFAKRFTIPK